MSIGQYVIISPIGHISYSSEMLNQYNSVQLYNIAGRNDLSEFKMHLSFSSLENIIQLHHIYPLGQPTVTAGRDHCFRICCPSVRPHFSNLEKQNNRKQCSLLAWLWIRLSGSLMTPVLLRIFSLLEALEDWRLSFSLVWLLSNMNCRLSCSFMAQKDSI